MATMCMFYVVVCCCAIAAIMARKAGAAYVLGQACLCYKYLPDEPDDGEAVWHVAHDDGLFVSI